MMAAVPDSPSEAADIFTEMLRAQGEAARQMLGTFVPEAAEAVPSPEALSAWGDAALKLQAMWLEFHKQQALPVMPVPILADPTQWMGLMQGWYQQMPLLDPRRQSELFDEGLALWEDVLAQYGIGPRGQAGAPAEPRLPRKDKRFADSAWSEQPVFALIHQTYLLLAERVLDAVDAVDGLDGQDREQLRFATRSVLDAMSPANFPLMNPVVLE